MNLFGLSPGELLLIGLVAMIVLGPEKLPEVAASVGKWIREFRRATEELTSQFADENPFTEIQRALALDELLAPTVITTLPDSPVAAPMADPVIETPTTTVSPLIPQPTVPERVKSYHFFGTPNHPGLDPEWVVGAPIRREVPVPSATGLADGDDDWLHGVPVLPEEPAPSSDEVILNQILATDPEVESIGADQSQTEVDGTLVSIEAVEPDAVAAATNGHDSATSLERLEVEAAPAHGAEEEPVVDPERATAEDAETTPLETEGPSVESDDAPVVATEESAELREDVTLILDPEAEARREGTPQEPAIVGRDGKARINEEHQP